MRRPVGLKQRDRILRDAKKSCEKTLVLGGQHFETIPRDIFQPPFVHNLCILELGYNNLEYLPPEIGRLKCLQELYLQNNGLKALPKELGKLVALQKLSLCHNQLVEIPLFFGELVKLEWVNFSGNFIEILPPWILVLLPRLRNLYILRNPIENVPRDVYIHGIGKVREFFKVCVTEFVDESQSPNHMLNGLPDGTGKVKRSLFSELLLASTHYKTTIIVDPKVEPGKVERDEGKSPQNEKKESKVLQVRVGRPPFPSREKLSSLYAQKLKEITTSINKSHSQGLELIKEQKEKIRLRQELRKLNISYLQQQNARRQLQPCPLSRRNSNLSLDLEIPRRDRRDRRRMTTSEYGTCSSLTDGSEPVNHLQGYDGHLWPIIADGETNETSTIFSSSDFDSCHPGSASEDQLLSDDFEIEASLDRRRHITLGDICVIIPEYNISGHLQSEFSIEVVEDFSYSPKLKYRQALASEVLRIEPHGAKFYRSDPAKISMPHDIKVGPNDRITCLCSDTGLGQRQRWEEMDPTAYKVFQMHVEIQATHFSLFAVVVTKGYPEAHKTIRMGVGGCLYVQEVPGVEVNFPKTSLLHDIDASVKVLYDDEPYDANHIDQPSLALAAPVVEVGPHGCQFNPHTPDSVTVRLPLPSGKQILEQFGDRQLTFWCSSTSGDEALDWQQFQPSMVYIDMEDSSLCSVYFSVSHFSFFKVVWDILDVVLSETKLRASQILPIFQFYISCQALMSESEDGIRFGICVLCYRFGKEVEGIGNFPIPVGSHSPKMIKTGQLTIRLHSGLFKADASVGENELTQTELFTGRPFVKQFACILTGEVSSYGNFGKVTIEQPSMYGGTECLFSFNLCKPNTLEPYDSSLAWEVQLTKELSGLLTIKAERDLGDEVWQDLADSLGYTEREIAKFSSCDEPLTMMIGDYKRRGGQAHKFIEALYRTGPKGSGSGLQGLQKARPQAGSFNVIVDQERSEISRTVSTKNMRKRKHEEVNWEDKFSDLASKLLDKWKRLGRVLNVSESKIREIELDRKQDGIQEQAYQMLLTWRDEQPDQCTLVTLSRALCKIGMGYVARQYCMAVELG